MKSYNWLRTTSTIVVFALDLILFRIIVPDSTHFPLFPHFPQIRALLSFLFFFLLPVCGVLAFCIWGLKERITWMCICSAIIMLVLFPVLVFSIPFTGGELVESTTNKTSDYGILDQYVAQQVEPLGLLPTASEQSEIKQYLYDYNIMFQTFDIYAVLHWKDKQDYADELERLAQFPAEENDEYIVINSLVGVSAAYKADSQTQTITYFVCSGSWKSKTLQINEFMSE